MRATSTALQLTRKTIVRAASARTGYQSRNYLRSETRNQKLDSSAAEERLLHDDKDIMASTNLAKNLSVDETRAYMNTHFKDYSGESYGQGWDELWKKNFMPWDRLVPSPALTDTLTNWQKVVGTATLINEDGSTRRKRALVPGCGRGVDVLLLQSFGYDAIGLEISPTALATCEEYAKEKANDEVYAVKDPKIGSGSRKFVNGDFYSDDWLDAAGLPKGTTFELIYDYTFFCAMNPKMRPQWAKRMSQLLASTPQANLICLEFPTTKPAQSGGPPFASPSKAYMEHLSHPGEEVAYTDDGEVKLNPFSESGPGALERVGHWQPADTHAIGKNKDGQIMDYISIWRHR